MLRLGSLFSGIGGIELGFEATGHFKTVWQVENDPYALGVLERHWPEADRHEDVRDFPGAPADVIAGGFPCQDISQAGRGEGIEGGRSGLWSEFARIIGAVRPRIVVVENVAILLKRGFGRVLGDLATLGYHAEWDCIPAAAVGAPHRRDRVFIVAHPHSSRCVDGCPQVFPAETRFPAQRQPEPSGPFVADADGKGSQGGGVGLGEKTEGWEAEARERSDSPGSGWWAVEPDVGRVADGVPHRVDRLRTLGNAVVPQVAEHIAWRVLGMIGQEAVA